MNSKQFKEWFKGSSIVGKDKNPLVVYHGSREGAGVIDKFKTPAFFSPDKMAADWYGDSRPYYLNIKNPAGYNDIIKAAKKAGVKDVGGEYPEVAKHSPYDGTNENDLVYIPKVREQLKSMGFDGSAHGIGWGIARLMLSLHSIKARFGISQKNPVPISNSGLREI